MNDLEGFSKVIPLVLASVLNNCRLRLMMLTDDIVLLADSAKGLQQSINRLEEFCRN